MIKSIFIALLICFSTTAIADEIEINVRTKSEPASALGIFFSSGKVVQQPKTSFERVNPDVVIVKLPYDLASLPSASPYATAYVLTVDNQIVFGDVRLVSASDSSDSFWRTPLCPSDTSGIKVQMPLPEQLNYLESLLQIRTKKRDVAQKVLSEKLTDDLTSRLQKLEKGFGLNYESPLSAELPSLELVERLSRLKNTIRLYKSSKEIEPVPTIDSKTSQSNF